MVHAKLGHIATITNGKSNTQDSSDFGLYPFFDRSTAVKRSNKFLFDCEAIIVPGEGTSFTPKYYNGKFDLHQRCYKIETASKEIDTKYLYYNLLANCNYFLRVATGSTVPSLRLAHFLDMDLCIHSQKEQQHIVDTIGSVDDLIEKYEEYSHLLRKIGNLLLMNVTDCECEPILNFCTFVKGKEIGSKNYSSKGNKPFIRVSNLENHEYDNYTDLAGNLESCQEEDILIALDGAPGRVAYGLNGYYSSGIYKIKCQKSREGLLYFYLTSDECQQIIKSNASGTTILHASKSIKEMNVPTCSEDVINKLNVIFENLVLISKQVDKLKKIKDALLHKYFD